MLGIALLSTLALGYNERGIIKVDNTTFDRIVDGSRNVLVRFDKEYSYGDAADAWKDFAVTVGESSADLLSVDVPVGDYGDKDNSDISERYGVFADDFPKFFLFQKGTPSTGKPVKFEGENHKEGLIRFVQEYSNVWIGLPGQVESLNTLASEFVKASEKAAVISKAEEAAGACNANDADAAKYYVKIMNKASASGDFVSKETTRLQNMIDDASVKPAKKEQFKRRLNVLSAFA